MRATTLKAALCAAFAISSLVAAAPAPAPLAGDPLLTTGVLPGGGTYLVRRTGAASPVAAVALWYRAPSSGFETIPTPGLGELAASTIAASTPITGTSLGRFVNEIGGRIAVTAYPNSIAVSAVVPAERAADVVRAMTVAYFSPVLATAGLDIARRDLAERALFRAFNPEETIGDALSGALFAGGPAKYPMLGGATDLAKIGLDRITTYAQRAFRPGNATLVITGDVAPTVVAAAVPGNAEAPKTAEPPLDAILVPAPAPVATSAPEPGLGLGWAGPPIANEREATALDFIADYLFRPETGVVQKAVAPTKASLSGKFVTYHDPGVVLITISGGDVAAARTLVDAALATIRKPLDPATFRAAHAAFTYHVLSDIQTPGELADTFGWYSVEGDVAYAPGAGGLDGSYVRDAQALTPAFVAATALKYLGRPGAVVSVAAKIARPAPAPSPAGAK